MHGWQQEEYLHTDINQLPMEPAIGTAGRIDVRGAPAARAGGLYPLVVSLRDAWMEQKGMHKWAAMGRAALGTKPLPPLAAIRRRASFTARRTVRSWQPSSAAISSCS